MVLEKRTQNQGQIRILLWCVLQKWWNDIKCEKSKNSLLGCRKRRSWNEWKTIVIEKVKRQNNKWYQRTSRFQYSYPRSKTVEHPSITSRHPEPKSIAQKQFAKTVSHGPQRIQPQPAKRTKQPLVQNIQWHNPNFKEWIRYSIEKDERLETITITNARF